MSNLIEVGDKVIFHWITDDGQLKGKVLHIPSGVGDLWYVEDEDGRVHAINTGCYEFDQIIKEPDDAS